MLRGGTLSPEACSTAHPNIHEVVILFKVEQAATEVRIIHLEAKGGSIGNSRKD